MKLEAFEESSERDKCGHLGGLVMTCPICGKEFGCNKAYHVYTALVNADGSIIVATAVINSGQSKRKKVMEVDEICWLRHKGQEVVRVYFILITCK